MKLLDIFRTEFFMQAGLILLALLILAFLVEKIFPGMKKVCDIIECLLSAGFLLVVLKCIGVASSVFFLVIVVILIMLYLAYDAGKGDDE